MPAPGQKHPTNPNLYWDEEANGGRGGWVPSSDSDPEPSGGGYQIWDFERGAWVQTPADFNPNSELSVGDVIRFGPAGAPAIYGGTDSITGAPVYRELEDDEWALYGYPSRDTTSSGSTPSYGSTQASQSQQEAFTAAQNEANRQFQLDLEALQQENARKDTFISEAGALTRQIASDKAEGKRLIASLQGVDPVRAAILARGGVQRYTTPAQEFRSDLEGFVEQAVPTYNAGMSAAELEGVVGQLSGIATGGVPETPTVGFAGGGYAGGGGLQFGNQKRAVMLGEGTGTGTEVGIVTPGMGITEVIPLAGGAEEGLTISSIAQALSPIYKRLGYSGQNAPRAYRATADSPFHLKGGLAEARQLGYRPRLLRQADTGETFYFDPDTNSLRSVGSEELFKQSGFRWQSVLNVDPSELAGFTRGSTLTSPITEIEGGPNAPKYGTRAEPSLLSLEGQELALPTIGELAGNLAGSWNNLDANTKRVIASAYGGAGEGEIDAALAALEDEIAFFTPSGTAQRGRTARFG